MVTAYARELGEWTAAQIVRLDPDSRTAAVLELDWSGPEPSSLADLGDVAPLRLTHHSWNGNLSYSNHQWVLPRSHKVVGALRLLHNEPSNSWSLQWHLGDQLARQRRWDSGVREDPVQSWRAEYAGGALDELLGRSTSPNPEVAELTIRGIDSLDCARLVRHFPELTSLHLYGRLGLLSTAHELNRLTSLRQLHIVDLFGMTEQDCLRPQCVPRLESLDLDGIPASYASAMRKAWQAEIPAGTHVSILRGRKPGWVEENRNNPLRDWDGQDHITAATYKTVVAQYKATRKAVLHVLAAEPPEHADRSGRMEEIGRVYGEAFNELDRRTSFIATIEREELYDALDHLMNEAEALHGSGLQDLRDSLFSGVDEVRDW